MEFKQTGIQGLIEVSFQRYGDSRGYFSETYKKKVFEENGISTEFIQENSSYSIKGVLRGLHLQKPPFSQAKLVRVIQGSVFDVAVDIRKDSDTYLQCFTLEISSEKNNALFIPRGFLHGFLALEDSYFQYQVDNYYNAESDGGVLWNDPDIGIEWPKLNIDYIISEKDKLLPTFSEFSNP